MNTSTLEDIERLEQIEELVLELQTISDSGAIIVVEGRKDAESLRLLGIKGEILLSSQQPLLEFTDSEAATYFEQLQKLKLPRLVTNGEENRRAIEELMTPFLVEVAKKEALEREIRETDDAIDKKVYALYGLTDEEIEIIEEQCKK